jgi:hypothetical protein
MRRAALEDCFLAAMVLLIAACVVVQAAFYATWMDGGF